LGSRAAEQWPVKLMVRTTISNGKDQETFELTTFGRYYQKSDQFFLQYEEMMEEGAVKSIVKVSKNETLILRSGAINMRMAFQKNKILQGRYETPFGTIEMITHTKKLAHSLEESDKKGSINIIYDLNMQGSHAGTYHMEMMFEEEKK
jgi:uncharacterized beta-barrel protein YwiB (DUF1934 family)